MNRYWRDDAKCTQDTSGLFDPPTGKEDNPRRRIEKAVRVCRACPVAAICFDEAVRNADSGVRAGELLDNGRPTRLPGRPTGGPAFAVERRDRLYAIIDMHHKGMGPTQIAAELGVSVRSVDNDLRRYVRRAA